MNVEESLTEVTKEGYFKKFEWTRMRNPLKLDYFLTFFPVFSVCVFKQTVCIKRPHFMPRDMLFIMSPPGAVITFEISNIDDKKLRKC